MKLSQFANVTSENEAEVLFWTQTFIKLVHAIIYTSLCAPFPVTERLSVFPTAASDTWYHLSLRTWKRADSLLRNPCSHEKGHDTMVYFTSPVPLGKSTNQSVLWFFSLLLLLLGGYWQFLLTAVQNCTSRAGTKLWTSWIFKIWVSSLHLVVYLPPPQPWYPDLRSSQRTLELLLELG